MKEREGWDVLTKAVDRMSAELAGEVRPGDAVGELLGGLVEALELRGEGDRGLKFAVRGVR
jgi:hypothetical protein